MRHGYIIILKDWEYPYFSNNGSICVYDTEANAKEVADMLKPDTTIEYVNVTNKGEVKLCLK